MIKLRIVLLAAAVSALPSAAIAKTPDDRYCGLSIKDEQGEMQLVLFKLKKREVIEDDFVRNVEAEGGVLECGPEMRKVHEQMTALRLQNTLERHRMLNTPIRPMIPLNLPRPKLP